MNGIQLPPLSFKKWFHACEGNWLDHNLSCGNMDSESGEITHYPNSFCCTGACTQTGGGCANAKCCPANDQPPPLGWAGQDPYQAALIESARIQAGHPYILDTVKLPPASYMPPARPPVFAARPSSVGRMAPGYAVQTSPSWGSTRRPKRPTESRLAAKFMRMMRGGQDPDGDHGACCSSCAAGGSCR